MLVSHLVQILTVVSNRLKQPFKRSWNSRFTRTMQQPVRRGISANSSSSRDDIVTLTILECSKLFEDDPSR